MILQQLSRPGKNTALGNDRGGELAHLYIFANRQRLNRLPHRLLNGALFNISPINVDTKKPGLRGLVEVIPLHHIVVHENATIGIIGHMNHAIFKQALTVRSVLHILNRHVGYVSIARSSVLAKELRYLILDFPEISITTLFRLDNINPLAASDARGQPPYAFVSGKVGPKAIIKDFNIIWDSKSRFQRRARIANKPNRVEIQKDLSMLWIRRTQEQIHPEILHTKRVNIEEIR